MTIFFGVIILLAMWATWGQFKDINERLDLIEKKVIEHDNLYRKYTIKV